MERRLLTLFVCAALFASEAVAELRLASALDWGFVAAHSKPSFVDGGQSKMRYGQGDDGLQLLTGYAQAQYDINAVWNAKVAVDVNPHAENKVGLIDAFVQYRPLPLGQVRLRAKVGAFRPPISFEHGADGWATLYTTNASAINSWVGEELGGVGVEVTIKRDLASAESDWYWALSGAALYGNDPAGTVLSWRGWSMNNWQTAMNGRVALPDIPIVRNTAHQRPYAEPFLELDGRAGYYAWGEIGLAGRARLRTLYYDNRADLAEQGRGQSTWCTSFWHVGFQASLPWNVGLVAQWMDGMTYAGEVAARWGNRHWVENAFDASFVLLTKTHDRHRVTVRRDWFGVDDLDLNPNDVNDEDGTGVTVSYQYKWSDRWLFGVEYLRADSTRAAREYDGEALRRSESSWFGTVRVSL